MRKLLFILLALCLLPLPALCEDAAAPEIRMGLSQTEFTSPAPVEVTIQITANADMPGPMALYAPDGSRIEDFGMPVLAAGETRTWQGVWQVTEQQILSGRVVFAVMYTCQAGNGSLERRTQSFYTAITQASRTTELRLMGNPSTGYAWEWQCWHWQDVTDEIVAIQSEYIPDDAGLHAEEARLGSGGVYCITLTGLAPGNATLTFTYRRPWEPEENALYTLIYHIRVNDDLSIDVLSTRFAYGT